MRFKTPLRYPGGKGKLTGFFKEVLSANDLKDATYIEPFAGGAGLAINLLLDGNVSDIVINDADRSIFAFWKCVTEDTDELVEMIKSTDVNMSNWWYQHHIQKNKESSSILDLGFSTFFLNRTNRSGILSGGVVGGRDQSGKYKMDARYNKDGLIKRIQNISEHSDHITVLNYDAEDLLRDNLDDYDLSKTLIYIDPPYFCKGACLYLNHYKPEDHATLSETIRELKCKWILSYDDTPEIRRIYEGMNPLEFDMQYSSFESRIGKEVFYCSKNIDLPGM